MLIRRMAKGEGAVCERVVRSLPGWFGIEQTIVDYAKSSESMETYVAEASGEVVGFITLNQRSPVSAEIHALALREEFHGKGVGRALVEQVERVLAARSGEYLEVKTLGPSRPCAEYDRTRAFYEHLGFQPLEENNLWGTDNPCLIMVKHLSCQRPSRNQRSDAKGEPSERH